MILTKKNWLTHQEVTKLRGISRSTLKRWRAGWYWVRGEKQKLLPDGSKLKARWVENGLGTGKFVYELEQVDKYLERLKAAKEQKGYDRYEKYKSV